MVFLHLIIAHLLGDFVFQSNDLILRKYKSWKGTFQHVCIIAFLSILMLSPILQHTETWIVIGVISVVHFLQDYFKIGYDANYNKNKSTLPFFLDQILHIGLIAFLSPMLKDLNLAEFPQWFTAFYKSDLVAIYLIGAILFSYFYDITLYQFTRQKRKKHLEYKPNLSGMLHRIALFTALYVAASWLFISI